MRSVFSALFPAAVVILIQLCRYTRGVGLWRRRAGGSHWSWHEVTELIELMFFFGKYVWILGPSLAEKRQSALGKVNGVYSWTLNSVSQHYKQASSQNQNQKPREGPCDSTSFLRSELSPGVLFTSVVHQKQRAASRGSAGQYAPSFVLLEYGFPFTLSWSHSNL